MRRRRRDTAKNEAWKRERVKGRRSWRAPRGLGQCLSRPANLSSLSLFIFIFRQAFAAERLVGRSERIRERGKRRMTGRGTDLDAALNGGLGAGPRKCAGG